MAIQSLREINNRRDFVDAFDTAMAGADQSLRSIWQFGKDQNLPKSYLIEFHPRLYSESNSSTESLFRTLSAVGQQFGARVRRTNDDSILYLSHQESSHSAEFIIDALNPRFLVFHTLSNVRETDRFIRHRLTHHRPEFDLFWFPVSMLESVERRERVTGWEASFEPLLDGTAPSTDGDDDELEESDREFLETFEPSENEVPERIPQHTRLRINIQQPNAFSTYKRLKELNAFPDVPLSSVLAERSDNELETHARARIKSYGKITGRGSDFLAYLNIVNGTLDNYAGIVTALESKYWLALEPSEDEGATGVRLVGEPFCVQFESEINVEAAIAQMFNCDLPFRLMGEPEKVSDDYYVIDAVDLHVGHPLSVELTSNMIRLYLYRGTCGNTIVRILTSLQHFIDSNLTHPPLDAEQ